MRNCFDCDIFCKFVPGSRTPFLLKLHEIVFLFCLLSPATVSQEMEFEVFFNAEWSLIKFLFEKGI